MMRPLSIFRNSKRHYPTTPVITSYSIHYTKLYEVDCTGHGVPGALLSFIGYFLLNSIVDHDRNLTAGQVLDMLHSGVRRTLRQDADDASARDGMDIALCRINYNRKELQYAGAHRPLLHVSGDKIEQYT